MKPGEFLLHVFHASLLKGLHVFSWQPKVEPLLKGSF